MSSEWIFFVDRSLGGLILKEQLEALGELVELHDDHFAPDTPDTQWLPEVAARSWLILSADQQIRSNTLEWLAVVNSGAKLFVLVSGNLGGQQQAQVFAGAVQKMKNIAIRETGAFIAQVYANGKVEVKPRNRPARRQLPPDLQQR